MLGCSEKGKEKAVAEDGSEDESENGSEEEFEDEDELEADEDEPQLVRRERVLPLILDQQEGN